MIKFEIFTVLLHKQSLRNNVWERIMHFPFTLCFNRKAAARIAAFTLHIGKKKIEFGENIYHS